MQSRQLPPLLLHSQVNLSLDSSLVEEWHLRSALLHILPHPLNGTKDCNLSAMEAGTVLSPRQTEPTTWLSWRLTRSLRRMAGRIRSLQGTALVNQMPQSTSAYRVSMITAIIIIIMI